MVFSPRFAEAALVLAFMVQVEVKQHDEVLDLAGEWRVVPMQPATPPSTSFEEWLRAQPGAIFTLTSSASPPLAMIHKDVGYRYFPALPTITISEGPAGKPKALGFLQGLGGHEFQGELGVLPGCWLHLSLKQSQDGHTLSGLARVNTKLSTRECRSALTKNARNGQPYPYTLMRVK